MLTRSMIYRDLYRKWSLGLISGVKAETSFQLPVGKIFSLIELLVMNWNAPFGNRFALALTVALAALVSGLRAEAKVQPAALFSDHAVFQQGRPIPVWGQAAPGEAVTVEFAGQQRTTQAGADGKWMVRLEALPASAEPRKLKIARLVFTDILVGEVWLGSGQSNMAHPTSSHTNEDAGLRQLLAGAPYPQVRLSISGGKWSVADSNAVARFSAQLFSFGQALHRELGVPVGLLYGAFGGTPSAYWLSEAAYTADPACREAIARFTPTFDYEAVMKPYEARLAEWQRKDAASKAQGGKGAGYPPEQPLRPGECWGRVGCHYDRRIRPLAPYAIRGVLWDQGEGGTGIQGLDQYTLMGALLRGWRQDWGQPDLPFLLVQKPSGGGCAWDYADPVTAKADKFAPLPPTMPNLELYRPYNWPGREGVVAMFQSQLRLAELPHAFLVTASDLGGGIHPTNKSGYGMRDCRVALGAVYGKPVAYYGPRYRSHEVKAGQVVIHFTHIGKGLAFRHGEKLQGFALAGADRQFVWADAAIVGDTVVVSSPQVPRPVAVRYACAENHPWANLFNLDGLPALPFLTDEGKE